MKQLLLVLLALPVMTKILAQETMALYENNVPHAKPITNREKTETGKDGILRISKVSEPQLVAFFPPRDKANGTAIIICPGGGYGILAFSHEGTDVAKVFNEWGITAFVLKYRLPDDSIMEQKETGPLQDAQRAIQLVRQGAQKWGIDENKIGIMGSRPAVTLRPPQVRISTMQLYKTNKTPGCDQILWYCYTRLSVSQTALHTWARAPTSSEKTQAQKR